MNKIRSLIIFPEDSSTIFLEEVIDHLSKIDNSIFEVIKVKPSIESHEQALMEIQKPYRTIIFMGHGTSLSLYGARSKQYKNESFITRKQFHVFKDKELILVSCDSTLLLKKNKQAGFFHSIGFGDLPTDWNDIQTAREVDANAYKGFSQENMNLFKECLVEILKYSLADFIKSQLTIRELFDLIILRINKRIVKYSLKNDISLSSLNDCLLKMKHESICIGS